MRTRSRRVLPVIAAIPLGILFVVAALPGSEQRIHELQARRILQPSHRCVCS